MVKAVNAAAGSAAPRLDPSAPPLVRFVAVQKTYDGEHLVVKNLNLDIRRGEFLTLLGPSGSGKTTSLMMLAGFEVPTEGEIFLDGRPIKNLPAHKRDIGMVFQNYALFPHMTIAENLAFPLSVRGMPKAEVTERVQASLAMIKLEKMAERRPGQLSGGQQQRVALARALVFQPKLVLMDEPLGALDKRLREHMQLEIKRLHEATGVTVVYVTHDQSEALTMSDRIAVFNDGIIQQIDSPAGLYEAPANSFVATFIGENNRLSGSVLEIAGEEAKVRLDNGADVIARPVNVKVGDRTTLSIRPERVRLAAEGEASHGVNLLPAVLSDLIYLGDHSLAVLDAAGNREFMVKLPPGAARDLPHGSAVTLAFDARDARALDPV
jgi:putative spermidine/putrescine transport system ATP-binding protein